MSLPVSDRINGTITASRTQTQEATSFQDLNNDILSLIFSFSHYPGFDRPRWGTHDGPLISDSPCFTRTLTGLLLNVALVSRLLYQSCIYHVQHTPLVMNIHDVINLDGIEYDHWEGTFYDGLLAWTRNIRPKICELCIQVRNWESLMVAARIVRWCDIKALHTVTFYPDPFGNQEAVGNEDNWRMAHQEFASIFVDHSPAVNTLDILHDCGLMAVPLLTSVSCTVEIVSLDFSRLNNYQGISEAIESMPHLRELWISGKCQEEFNIKSKSLQKLYFQMMDVHVKEIACPSLKELDLWDDTDNFNPSSLMGCGQSLESLKVKTLCLPNVDAGRTHVHAKLKELSRAIEQMPILKNLDLENEEGCELHIRSASLESIHVDRNVRLKGISCPWLKELDLWDAIDNLNLSNLMDCCQSLESLKVHTLYLPNDDAGMILVHAKLKELSRAIEQMPMLKNLDLANGEACELCIRSESLESIQVNGNVRLKGISCPLLKELRLRAFFKSFNPSNLTDCCQSLENLKVILDLDDDDDGDDDRVPAKLKELSWAIEQIPFLKNLDLSIIHVDKEDREFRITSASLESLNVRKVTSCKITECRCPLLKLYECRYYGEISCKIPEDSCPLLEFYEDPYFKKRRMEKKMRPYGLPFPLTDENIQTIWKKKFIDHRAGDLGCEGLMAPDACVVRFHGPWTN